MSVACPRKCHIQHYQHLQLNEICVSVFGITLFLPWVRFATNPISSLNCSKIYHQWVWRILNYTMSHETNYYTPSRTYCRFGHSPAISSLLTVPPFVFASKSKYYRPLFLYEPGYIISWLDHQQQLFCFSSPTTLTSWRFARHSSSLDLPCVSSAFPSIYQMPQQASNILERSSASQGVMRQCRALSHGARLFWLFHVGQHRLRYFFRHCLLRLGNNLSGQYKRGVGMALHIGIGNFSGAIASNIYRTRDHPRYIYGREYFSIWCYLRSCYWWLCQLWHPLLLDGFEIMFVGIGFVTVPLIAFLYKRINAQRDRMLRFEIEGGIKKIYTDHEIRELGDKAPEFRYTL